MGEVITINDHLDIEVRGASFRIHDDEQPGESPEFGFNRVYPLKAAIEEVLKHPRFVEWLRKRESGRLRARR